MVGFGTKKKRKRRLMHATWFEPNDDVAQSVIDYKICINPHAYADM